METVDVALKVREILERDEQRSIQAADHQSAVFYCLRIKTSAEIDHSQIAGSREY
jgi:hypothetical protein